MKTGGAKKWKCCEWEEKQEKAIFLIYVLTAKVECHHTYHTISDLLLRFTVKISLNHLKYSLKNIPFSLQISFSWFLLLCWFLKQRRAITPNEILSFPSLWGDVAAHKDLEDLAEGGRKK